MITLSTKQNLHIELQKINQNYIYLIDDWELDEIDIYDVLKNKGLLDQIIREEKLEKILNNRNNLTG